MLCFKHAILVAAIIALAPVCLAQDAPARSPMVTRWAEQVTPDNVHAEYPRPQMVRQQWKNLNGNWQYAIRPKAQPQPDSFDGEILVPFAVESKLSGVGKRVGEDNRLWYRREFAAPDLAQRERLLLHFGAVDWQAIVWVNGRQVGRHQGGYDAFTFDITEALVDESRQEIVVSVWDPTEQGTQPRGKQVSQPQGIWYTPVTGIWQTIWLEPVAAASIASLKAVPDVDAGLLRVSVDCRGAKPGDSIEVIASDGGRVIASVSGKATDSLSLKIDNPKLWSPQSPFLYDLQLSLKRDGRSIDRVESYFGMRKISLGKDRDGYLRLLLNNQPLFQFGPLDQGWWPDGLYTAPTDAALRFDVEMTKRLGFNMLRKHVKVEPARFYYHCDKLGMLVWQDMPNGNPFRALRVAAADQQDAQRDAESARQFEAELKALIEGRSHFPSVVVWVPFNEGWGQYDTARIADWVKHTDPTRLVNATSGWADRGVGDMYDAHMYPGPGMESGGRGRAAVLGEFGGLGLPVQGHLWWDKRNWGYRTYQSREELNGHYRTLIDNLGGMISLGLAAAIYTQTTDVEGEVNGLLTYDRRMVKFDPEEMRRLSSRLYKPWPSARILLADSEHQRHNWRYTLTKPAKGWQSPDFDDSSWASAAAPFRSDGPAFFPKGSTWKGKLVWLRRSFQVAQPHDDLRLKVFHNVDSAQVYLNGVLVAELSGMTKRHYGHVDISRHAGVLRTGANTISVHAVKQQGARGFDVGIYTADGSGQ